MIISTLKTGASAMKILIIVITAAALLTAAVLVLRGKEKKRDMQYALDRYRFDLRSILTSREYDFLLALFDNAFSHSRSGSFRGGGVWREEASADQKELLEHMKKGRIDYSQLTMLMEYIGILGPQSGEDASGLLDEIYRKLDLAEYNDRKQR